VSLVAAQSGPRSNGVGNEVRRRREGIQARHSRRCASRGGSECSCTPTFQAQVWSARDRKPIRKTFPTVSGALAWRQETQVALRRGTLRAPTATTLAEAAEAWLSGAEAGIIRTRSGDRYKPSALRSYRHALQSKLLPELGRLRLSAIRRNDLQDLVDRMVAAGRSPSTVRNTILPLRAIYRRAIDRDQLAVNPTLKLRLPAVRGKRDDAAGGQTGLKVRLRLLGVRQPNFPRRRSGKGQQRRRRRRHPRRVEEASQRPAARPRLPSRIQRVWAQVVSSVPTRVWQAAATFSGSPSRQSMYCTTFMYVGSEAV
jgi:hypothetical protein